MFKLTILYSMFLLSLLIATPGFSLHIQLHEEALVTENFIRLGDIATITPDNDEAKQWTNRQVNRSPALGESKIIYANSLIESFQYVKGADTIQWSGPENITVKRKGQTVSKEQLKQIIAEFLQQNQDKLPQADMRFTSVRAPEKIILPDGDIIYTVTPSKPGILGSTSFSIIFQLDGKTVKNCTVRGKLEAISEVVTAAVNVRRGTILTADKIKLARVDISNLDATYPATDMVIGMQATRTIRAGRAIDDKNVEIAPVIKKGERVKIVASKGSLQISTNGIAIMDGRPGDFIRVKNTNSSKLVYCQVYAPGIVYVEF